MKQRKNYTFIVASSICMFLLLIVIAGNFGGKGTRAADEYICPEDYPNPTGRKDEYCCQAETLSYTSKESENCELYKEALGKNLVNESRLIIAYRSLNSTTENNETTDTECQITFHMCKSIVNGEKTGEGSENQTGEGSENQTGEGSENQTGEGSGNQGVNYCTVSLNEIPSTITAGTSVSVTATTTLNEGLTVQSYKWSTGGTAFDSSSSGNLTHEGHKLSDNISFKTLNKNGTLGVSVTVTLSNNSTCSKSIEFNVGDMGDNLVTIKFMNGDTIVDTKTCKTENNVSGDYELCLKGISTPGPQTKTGFYFKGWGREKDCTSSSLPSNYYLTPRVSATYYACFDNTNPDGPNPKDIDKKRCSISFETPVVNDRRYLNCKYVGVSYGTSADDGVNIDQGVTRRDVIRTCCEYKGYTWIGENYGPQGGEYCIKCSGKPSPSSPSPSSPSPSSPSPSNKNPTSNPPTGATLIFVVWSIGLAMTVYAFWYFKSQYNN